MFYIMATQWQVLNQQTIQCLKFRKHAMHLYKSYNISGGTISI